MQATVLLLKMGKWFLFGFNLISNTGRTNGHKIALTKSFYEFAFLFFCLESRPELHLFCRPGPLGCTTRSARAKVYHAGFCSCISGRDNKMASLGWLFGSWLFWWLCLRLADGNRWDSYKIACLVLVKISTVVVADHDRKKPRDFYQPFHEVSCKAQERIFKNKR